MATLQLGHSQDEPTPRHKFTDFDWVFTHWEELLNQYGEVSILVYNKQVIGTGATYQDAVDDAKAHLPDTDEVIMPIHQWLYQKQKVIRLQPTKEK